MKIKIESLFKSREEIPLFYSETGSRLMGIQNAESDYDIRGFHLQSRKNYFDFQKRSETIDYKENNIDFLSYDIDKMFGLILNSNPSTFELLRAEPIYVNQLPDWSTLKNTIIENINYKPLFHYYMSVANGNIKQMDVDRNFTHKTVFYCIHGLLCAELSAKQIIPELKIKNLLSQFNSENDLIKIIEDSLHHKKLNGGKEELNTSDKKLVLSTVKRYIDQLDVNVPEINKQEKLAKILSAYIINVKELFYLNPRE